MMKLFSIVTRDTNEASFGSLLNLLECDKHHLLGMYFRDDPRHDPSDTSSLDARMRAILTPDNRSLAISIKGALHDYMQKPDIYTLWKFMLLAHHAVSTEAGESAGIMTGWTGLHAVGANLENCTALFEKANALFSEGAIPVGLYADAVSSIVMCRLDMALYEGLLPSDVLRLAANNEAIDGCSVEDNEYGTGELLQRVRRLIEEFTGIRIEVPEGCDPDEDAYMEKIDWDEVADMIQRAIG